MSDAARHVGTVTDVHGREVKVSVDCDAVKIDGPPGMMLGPDARDSFGRYYFDADTAAWEWAQEHGGSDGE